MNTQPNPYQDDSILYILGAGASANAIPIVKDMRKRLALFGYALYCRFALKNYEPPQKLEELLQPLFNEKPGMPESNMIDCFNDIYDIFLELKGMSSIDTLAKKFYLQEKQGELDKVKSTIQHLIKFEQLSHSVDVIANHRDELITNAPIYERPDHNLEKTILAVNQGGGKSYNHEDLSKKISEMRGFLSRHIEKLPNESFESTKSIIDPRYINFLLDVFNNGSDLHRKLHIFSWNYDTQFDLAAKELNLSNRDFFKEFSRNLHKPNGDIEKGIKFCFESENKEENSMQKISAALKKICFKQVVIIGYSFPFYNRAFDSILLSLIAKRPYFNGKRKCNFFIVEPNEKLFDERKRALEAILELNIRSKLPRGFNSRGFNYYIDYQWSPDRFFIPPSF